MNALPADLKEFLTQYATAFNALDGNAVAALYHEPSGIYSDTGYVHWPTQADVTQNMVALCDLYRKHHYKQASFSVASVIVQSADCAVVDVAWTIEHANHQPTTRFNTTYNLVKQSGQWRVLLCTAYSEKKLR